MSPRTTTDSLPELLLPNEVGRMLYISTGTVQRHLIAQKDAPPVADRTNELVGYVTPGDRCWRIKQEDFRRFFTYCARKDADIESLLASLWTGTDKLLKPHEVAAALRVDAKTVVRWSNRPDSELTAVLALWGAQRRFLQSELPTF